MTTAYASDYDPYNTAAYDPQFTANISNRMQVPDSIHLGDQGSAQNAEESPRTKMKVPERILVAGDNQHVGLREEFRNMDLEFSSLDYSQSAPALVGLSTPPRVLTVEDSFPGEEERGEEGRPGDERRGVPEKRHDQSILNGLISMDTSYRSMTPPVPLSEELMADDSLMHGQEDDDVTIRRQVARLQRHVIHLEEENFLRSRREMILYPTLLAYFLFHIGKWFFTRN